MCPSVACICTASPDVCRGDPVDLFITIIDVEDTAPVFDGLPYIKTIYENQLLGTSVIKLKATDGDRGVAVPNKVQYNITGGNTDTDFPFSIDLMNGTIEVSKILDADNPLVRSRGGLYLFTVTATEVNGTGQFDPSVSVSSTQVSITVLDVNDNLPEFKQGTYSATVQENTPKGAPLLMSSTIEVEDIDQIGNNMFRVVIKKDGAAYTDFTTLPNENQTINGRSSITIIVVNSSVLDYEVRKNITFQLVAEALNGTGFITNLTSVTVSLQITDVNDNSPYFPSQSTHFNVPENASFSTIVTQVNASDLDSGDYGTITFSLEDSETAFSINNQTGKLIVNSLLDRETRAVYNLAILATDSPLHPEAERRRSRLQININVTDVNDNAPEWTQSVPYVTVLESTPVGTNITQLLATDRDEGLNGQIVFSIAPNTNGSTLFNVLGDNGKAFISVKNSLVNNVGLRTVIVVATDRGSPPLSSNVTISILVVDENQNKPVFVQPNQSAFNESTGKIPEIVIPEEIPPGSFLYQLSATDADQGLNGLVFYYLDFTLGEDSEYFRVDRVSGNMTSVKRLDREKQEIYEIRVKAEDNGQPASLSTSLPIRLRLRDIDDNSPTYDKVTMPQTMLVTEEMSPVSMGNITPATDIDLYPNNITCYYLYGGDNLTSFTLNKTTGNLTLIHKVDREKMQFMNIVIQASENCNESSMTSVDSMNPSFNYNSSDSSLLYVRVKVTDINDNPPKFVSTLLSTAVINDIDLGTEVMTLAGSVTDADTPENSRNMFRLLNITLKNDDTVLDTNKQAFVVTVNGSIVTNIRYRSDIVGYFSLFVEAYDERNQKDVAEIRIFVISNLQRVRLVFNRLPNQVEETKNMFIKELSDVLKLDLVMDKVVTHTLIDGVQDPTKTDAFIHGRELSTLNVVSASELSRRFDYDQNARTVLYKYGVGEARALTTDSTDTSNEDLKRTFAIVAAVLAIAMVSLLLVLIHLVRMYRHRLRAATTMVYSSTPKEQELFEPPGTNKYYSAENPLFGKEIKPALLDDDKVSNSSLDDNVVDTNTQIPEAPNEPEEQEVVLQISESPAASPGHKKDLNHNPHLDEVLEAYQNKGFEDDDEPDSRLGQSGRSDRLRPASHRHNRPKIPEAPEGVTKFSENFLSYETGYQNINYSTSGRGHVDYTDI
uniref:Cadherin domain-containing protein n=1 Tax=Biomphalaria glabrata TaxID=6526 RepID=A0A2C9KA32_BIOGL